MKNLKKLLLNTQFYLCNEKYVGCTPQRNYHLDDCEDGEGTDPPSTSNDYELPSQNKTFFILGDCEDESYA